MKEARDLAKKLNKQIEKEGWTIDVHTKILALLHLLTQE